MVAKSAAPRHGPPSLPALATDESARIRAESSAPLAHGRLAGRISALDALRGIAVVGVIAFHIQRDAAFWMWSFVDLFFVISGFLITRIVLLGDTDHARFLKHFWMRRILRIWPVYYLTLFLLAAAMGTWAALHGKAVVQLSTVQSLFFMQFTELYAQPTSADLAIRGFMPAFLHSWSIAVEEQFYLLWPLLIIALRRRGNLLLLILPLLVVASAIAREAGVPGFLLLTRMDGLAAGSMLAVIFVYYGGVGRVWSAIYAVTLLASMPLVLVYLVHGYSPGTERPPLIFDYHPLITTAFAFAYAGLIGLLLSDAVPTIARLLRWRPLIYVGGLSYAIYMFHAPLLHLSRAVGDRFGIFNADVWNLLALPLILLAAHCSGRWIEQPLLRLRHRYPVSAGPSRKGTAP